MADAVTSNLYDGSRNVNLTVTDISDGTGLTLATFLDVSTLVPNPGAHLKIRRIRYSVTNMIVTLYWAGTPNVPIANIGQGEDILDWSKDYSGGLPNNATSPTGNILVTAVTIGSATAGFTITLECIKGVRSVG
jgi:hypothetical protein